ncbi:hypothetical protein SPHINGO8BC_150280 [Sphingobacterium multivorum]|uniref:Uncharacterized protein n=1 Tax=Sphingobacterium multivorum TaxID=28454 RepID=A0A654A913_SPHMU|nr:hypothetical protein SPHINGO8BC_150280 [Sphingobacterium multivorum]
MSILSLHWTTTLMMVHGLYGTYIYLTNLFLFFIRIPFNCKNSTVDGLHGNCFFIVRDATILFDFTIYCFRQKTINMV